MTVIEIIDYIVSVFFTIEHFLSLLVSPRKVKFMKKVMSMVDLLAIITFYVSLVLEGLEDYEIIGYFV